MAGDTPDLTPWLRRLGAGEERVTEEVFARVYRELRAMAQRYMATERPGHTLQATALVHEVYLQLVGDRPVEWADRAHFYRAAAEAMRHILVDHARARRREKRGGDWRRLPLDVADLAANHDPEKILALDEALRRLEVTDPRGASVVRLRFFAGLSTEETAKALDLSERTVKREWSYAKAWLLRAIGGEP